MKNIILIVSIFLVQITAYSETSDPENWCRWGIIDIKNDFKIGVIKKTDQKKIYFYKDQDQCPNETDKKCQHKAFLIKDDKVLISKNYKDWSCVKFLNITKKKKVTTTTGWISTKNITVINPVANNSIDSWLGDWSDGYNSLKLTSGNDGKIKIEGEAVWGSGMNIHTGQVSGTGKPNKNTLEVQNNDDMGEDCKLNLLLLDQFLIAQDNNSCGGLNVSFSSVYTRSK